MEHLGYIILDNPASKMTKKLSNRVFVKNTEIVYRQIAGEYLLIPIRSKMTDLDKIFILSEVSARIWELVDGRSGILEITNRILQEYASTYEIVLNDTNRILIQLEKIGAIREKQ